MKNNKNIFIIGGGTAGHVLPAIQLSKEFIKHDYNIIFITDSRMYDFVKKNISNRDINILCLKGRGFYKRSIVKNIKSICLLVYAFIQSLNYIIKYKPIISYGFGGAITLSPIIMSKVFKIPIILHEGNIVLGKANKLLYKYANILTTFFPILDNNSNNLYNYKYIGMPVRKEIENIYKNKYEIKNNKLINILITGGSLGAEVMATKIATALCFFPKEFRNKISILQQVREENYSYLKKLYDHSLINYKLETYIKNMPESLNWCHLIICRSGAGTIAENLVAGRPSIMIPLPSSSDNHQMKNALMIEKLGAGLVIRNNEINDQNKLIFKLKSIIFNSERLCMMSKSAKNNSILGAEKKLVNLGKEILNAKN